MATLFGNITVMMLLCLWLCPTPGSAQVCHRDTVVFLRAQHPNDPSKKRERIEFQRTDTTFTWLKCIPSRCRGEKVVSGHFVVRGLRVVLYATDTSVHRRYRLKSRTMGGMPDRLLYHDILKQGPFRRLKAIETRYVTVW